MNSLLQDVRYGFRMLAKAPGFTLIAVLTLALGIGANTAIFSAVYGIVLKPLPYYQPSQLVRIVSDKMNEGIMLQAGVSLAAARDIQAQCPTIAEAATYDNEDYTLTGMGAPEQLQGVPVAGNFFSLLGVQPLLGRPILPSDTAYGHGDVVVLSYSVWKGLMGGDAGWIGREITLNGKPYLVIGVMPPKVDFGGSRFGSGLDATAADTVWTPSVPSSTDKADRDSRSVDLVARLKPGATVTAIQAQLKALCGRLAASYPKTDAGWELHADVLKAFSVGYLDEPLLLLLGAVGFVLLIACVNVSGLLLARGWGRQKEVAIREALGATRFRIARQFLSESMLLALAGGALGLLLSVWGIAALRAMAPPDTPRLDEVHLSSIVLWFTLGVSILAGILFGLVPALQVSGRRIERTLKEGFGGSVGAVSGRRPRKLRGALVVIEVALAVVLVAGATLTARSLAKIAAVDLGFRTDHLLTMTVNFSKAVCDTEAKGNSTQCKLAEQNILSRVQSLPGVQAAAEVSSIPLLSSGIALNLSVEGQAKQLGFAGGAPIWYRYATLGYFSVMGLRVLKGRSFSSSDVEGASRVAVVNETFAKKYLSDQPLGKRISQHEEKNGQRDWLTVVGEVSDEHDFAIEAEPEPEFYAPTAQAADRFGSNLMVRTAGDPMGLIAAVKNQIAAVDPSAPLTHVKTMDQIVSGETAQPRFQTLLLSAFGALGFVLAMVGIYGVISYDVSQRTREIGLRLALGAQPKNVLGMVVREGMLLAGVGILVGIGGALAMGRLVSSLLYQIKPTDPATFISVSIVLAAVALMACYLPARRAMRVEPMVALRYE